MSAATPAAARTSSVGGRLPRHLALLAVGVVVTASLVPPALAAETTEPTGVTAATAASQDVQTAAEQVAQLGAEVEAAAAEYATVEARLVAQQNRVAAADARSASQATLVRMLEQQVVALAVQTYKSGSVDPQLSLLATGRIEAVSSTTLLGMLTARRAVTLEDVRSAEAELQQLQGTARTELEAVQALQADLTQRRADIEARLAGAKDVLAVAEAEAQRQILLEEARTAAEASRGRPGEDGVDGDSRPSGSLGDLVLPPVGSGLLATPTPGRQAAYGWRIHPVYGVRKFHSGMDIITGCGTPVVAAADGVVESATWEGSYGNIVVLRHGESTSGQMSTAYAHLADFVVTSGPVSRGQVIGYVGTTGLSTGCHLHFEVRIDGQDVDPAGFI